MRVVHVPYTYAPDPLGGTEVYVANLIRALNDHDVQGVIAAPGSRTESYDVDGIAIARFRASEDLTLDALYGCGDAAAAREFGTILDARQPDLVHFHAFTSASSMLAVRAARDRGLPVVFTYHSPAVTCQRGTLLQYGRTVCNGLMEVRRCTSCSLHGHGMPRALATVLARLPGSIGRGLQARGLRGGPWTALRMSSLMHSRQAAIGAFLHAMDRIVAPAAWVEEVLVLNGIAADKIRVIGQGVRSNRPNFLRRSTSAQSSRMLKIGFFGRLDRAKGAHILIAALARLPGADIRLDIHGVSPGSDDPYVKEVSARAARDSRVSVLAPVASDLVIDRMASYDMIAVPSQCLETGPLVILEAFAAAVPVLASNIGGIAERVRDGENGLLVPYADIDAWRAALERVMANRALLERLKAAIARPPTMEQISARMKALYSDVVGNGA